MRLRLLGCSILSVWFAGLGSPAFGQTNNGYVGIYADSVGSMPCMNVPPFTNTKLYVLAKTAGESSAGISGAEFRIEVTNPAGWLIAFAPAPNAGITLGNPIDINPDPDQGGGVSISFASCQTPNAAGIVQLGVISIFNSNGSPTQLLVERHSTPTNPGFPCPLFIRCDRPLFSKTCMSLPVPDPCAVGVGGSGTVPGDRDSVSAEARAIRDKAIQSGLPEAYLSWRTPEEGSAWKQNMPTWMKSVSQKVLDRIRLLHEKNVLVHGRRHLAVEYSTSLVPIDSLARLRVELRATDMTTLDAEFFSGIGGQLIAAAPRYGLLTAWVPPEQIEALAVRPEVVWIHDLPAIGSNTFIPKGR